jgi:ferrochelatase
MTDRYERIGGSPLHGVAERIAKKLSSRLGMEARAAGRLWHPYPREVVGDAERVYVLPLAQHSARVYGEAAKRDLEGREVIASDDWGQEPALLDAFARRVREVGGGGELVLTAHSLPKGADDRYESQARASAQAVAERVKDLFPIWQACFQSQGAGAAPGTWLGPTLLDMLDATKAERVVVGPIGFLVDHVEILYDIDIEAKAHAHEKGITLARSRSLGDDDDFIDVLEGLARRLVQRGTS